MRQRVVRPAHQKPILPTALCPDDDERSAYLTLRSFVRVTPQVTAQTRAARARVEYQTPAGVPGAGWFWVNGAYREGPFDTETEAWADAALRLAVVQPGHVAHRSRAYGRNALNNVRCPSGRLGASHHLSRFEVREVRGGFILVSLESYQLRDRGEVVEQRDCGQRAEGWFKNVAAALPRIEEHIRCYERTDAEEGWAAAWEMQRQERAAA